MTGVKVNRSETRSGSRSELIQHLAEMATGWGHLSNDKLKAETEAALEALRKGALTVRAGHTTYEVDPETLA
jgi:hypothetical protein